MNFKPTTFWGRRLAPVITPLANHIQISLNIGFRRAGSKAVGFMLTFEGGFEHNALPKLLAISAIEGEEHPLLAVFAT